MECRTEKGVRYLTSDAIEAEGSVNAFATRVGGVSGAPYDTLNFGVVSGDNPEGASRQRALNMRRLGTALGVESLRCALVTQVHGNTVVKFDPTEEPESGAPTKTEALSKTEALAKIEADAIISATPSTAVGILTADCLPILLFDPVTGAVGAVHAGWRGTYARIVVNAVEAMAKEYGSKSGNIRTALGPCIGPCCYTVQEEFYEKFLAAFGSSIDDSFKFVSESAGEGSERSVAFDLQSANKAQLLEAGVGPANIDLSGECTSCNADLFFSYRRDVTSRGGSGTGRQLSMIMATASSDRRCV
ncbi:MAG: peptidoglycan editing factor PgeF [Proteobacteria bacterium]|nr:peptidoglycan editing factor PgeF [Pseudomonadota bacterium]